MENFQEKTAEGQQSIINFFNDRETFKKMVNELDCITICWQKKHQSEKHCIHICSSEQLVELLAHLIICHSKCSPFHWSPRGIITKLTAVIEERTF